MLSNTENTTNHPKTRQHCPGSEQRSKDDPFTIVDGHYVGDDGFAVPNNFSEFFERFPHYIRMWVHKHAYWCPSADQEDLTQDLVLHMQHLGPSSKHRLPGANHKLNGCTDVIETFDPHKQHGASEHRFRNYINLCLANKFRSMHSKRAIDALSQKGNLSFTEEAGPETPGNADDVYLHSNSEEFRNSVSRREKQREDHVFVREFTQFVGRKDPTVLRTITAVSETATHEDAAERLGVSNYEYFRMHDRLRQLAESFVTGAGVPYPRRRYRRRVKRAIKRTPVI